MNKLHWMIRRYMAEETGNGDAGGGAAPAGEPAGEAGDSVDWGDMGGDAPGSDDLDAGGSQLPGEEEEDPDADPAASTQTPTTGNNQSEQNATPVQSAQPQQKTPEELAAEEKKAAEDYAKWEQGQIESLTKAYALSEDDATRLQTEPEVVLPEIAARLHMQVVKQALNAVERMVPQMLKPALQQESTEAKAQEYFFGMHPELNAKDHMNAIMEAGKFFRKMNPKATAEEAAKGIGDLVKQSLGIKAKPAAEQQRSTNGKPGVHRPAGAGSGSKPAPATKPKGDNAWADLIDD